MFILICTIDGNYKSAKYVSFFYFLTSCLFYLSVLASVTSMWRFVASDII